MLDHVLGASWIHLGLLAVLPFLTYFHAIWGTWVSDDFDGVTSYRGDWKDPQQGQPPDKWKRGPVTFHTVLRHFRWLLGRVPKKDQPKDQPPEFFQDHRRHHRLSLYLLGAVGILLYLFLRHYVGSTVAFLTCVLFVVHPIGVQNGAWISGIGYVIGLFFCLAGLNFIVDVHCLGWMATPLGVTLSLVGYGLLQWMAVEAMFATAGIVLVLVFLQEWPFALVAALSVLYCLANTFRSAVELRRKNFEEQQMGRSTRLYPRKLVVVAKSLYYYLKLSVFPKRLGLYHKFLYHYDLPDTEQEDRYFWAGTALAAAGIAVILIGGLPARLGVVWFLAFIMPFLNWITANQTFSERYAWMPAVGICLLVASCLQSWLWVYWLLVGIALMRTWCHLPTFDNEVNFYLSNIWNFPDHEVAFGNLGYVYSLRCGLRNAAEDMWRVGISVNPAYDVNWYNLGSMLKAKGFLTSNDPNNPGARECFLKAISSKTCHFPVLWKKELEDLDQMIHYASRFNELSRKLDQFRLEPSKAAEAIELSKALSQIQELQNRVNESAKKDDEELLRRINDLSMQKIRLTEQQKILDAQRQQIKDSTETGLILKQQWGAIDALHQRLFAPPPSLVEHRDSEPKPNGSSTSSTATGS